MGPYWPLKFVAVTCFWPVQQQVLDPLDEDWSNPAVDRAGTGPHKGRDWYLPLSLPGGSYFREKY